MHNLGTAEVTAVFLPKLLQYFTVGITAVFYCHYYCYSLITMFYYSSLHPLITTYLALTAMDHLPYTR